MTENCEKIEETPFQRWRKSGRLLVLTVTTIKFLDQVLDTIVVPIILQFFHEINIKREYKFNVTNHHSPFISTDSGDFLLELKIFVQLFASVFVGFVTNRYGCRKIMFAGLSTLLVSSLVFAFGSSYEALFLARAIQGFGSACLNIAGTSAIAETFLDDERTKAMGLTLIGSEMGALSGLLLTERSHQKCIFVIISFAIIINSGLLFRNGVVHARVKRDFKPPSLIILSFDLYIILVSVAIFTANLGYAMLAIGMPSWTTDATNMNCWEWRMNFWPGSISYIIAVTITCYACLGMARWTKCMLGVIIYGCGMAAFPLSRFLFHLNTANFITAFGAGVIQSTLLPEFARIVDIRHKAAYGNAYAINNMAMCSAYGIGSLVCAVIIQRIGFSWTMIGFTVSCFLFAPWLYFLRNPRTKERVQEKVFEGTSTTLLKNETF